MREELDPLERKVLEIVEQRKHLLPGSVTLDSSFAELGIDSLDGLDLLFTFEDAFDIELPDDAARGIRRVRDATEALKRALAGRGAPPA